MRAILKQRWVCGVIVAGLAVCGCSAKTEEVRVEPGSMRSEHRVAVPQNQSTLLVNGQLPLIHMVGTGGNVHVVDATSGQTLYQGPVAPQSILSVTKDGITTGRTRVMQGRLAEDHLYQLWWDPRMPAQPMAAPRQEPVQPGPGEAPRERIPVAPER